MLRDVVVIALEAPARYSNASGEGMQLVQRLVRH
jgi:hypothetical protein